LSINIDETNQQSVFEELKDVKKKHPRKFIVAASCYALYDRIA
jgi:hypothetical protein